MTAHGFIPSPALETYNTNIIYSEAGACELIKARQKSLTYLVSRRRPGTCKSIEISGGLGNVARALQLLLQSQTSPLCRRN